MITFWPECAGHRTRFAVNHRAVHGDRQGTGVLRQRCPGRDAGVRCGGLGGRGLCWGADSQQSGDRGPMTDRAPIQRKRLGGASDDGELNEFTPLQINADEWTWG